MRYSNLFKLLLVVFLLGGGAWVLQGALAEEPMPELTKQEALALYQFETQRVVLVNKMREYADALYRKYNVDPKIYSIDINNGKFIKNEEVNSSNTINSPPE